MGHGFSVLPAFAGAIPPLSAKFVVHGDYAANGWIYLAYSEQGKEANTSMTVVVRGRIRENRWVNQQEDSTARLTNGVEPVVHWPPHG